MTCLEKIEREIYRFRSENRGRNPSLIILHPLMRDYVISKIQKKFSFPSDPEKPTFNGIRIIRSFDIEEDEIIVK